MNKAFKSGTAVTAVLLALTTLSTPAMARDRSSSFTGPKGQTVMRNVSRSHGDVSSTTTGPNGKSTSRVVDRSPEGTQAVLTGPNGQTIVRQTTRQP
ncbi:hypothetical protein KBW71_25900 [Hydrogenophaga aromaticivorans]|uniref:hypothetical protein n=1 Tax=Hydrogenophaga aromaticivorans TaxID=2610898 RepID=UPI001B360395|nr:hypothetical protein [Hydrogenophaga aromaticivorans]MBQ0921884.1 hypothetical protein [Hydrogenophaga aromaticivorans]